MPPRTLQENPTDLRRLRFNENVRSPNLVYLGSGGLLGLMAGALTALPIAGAVDGAQALGVYAALGTASLITAFVMLNFLALMTTVSEGGLEFRLGLFARRFSWNQIKRAETKRYQWTAFLGWGVRVAPGGRRAWSLLGVSGGVEVQIVNARGAELSYFISSARGQELAAVLQRGIEEHRAGPRAAIHGETS